MSSRLSAPIDATSVLADLRNFTAILNASAPDADGVNGFCHFVADVYQLCLASCLAALPPGKRAQPPLYINSTGDGALAVFTGERHFAHGMLAAILLDRALERACAAFNAQRGALPSTSFGIGVESGPVSRVTVDQIETYIGPCINVAARSEAVSKTLMGANTVFSDGTIERVSEALFGKSFEGLRNRERSAPDDATRLAIHDEMGALNQRLCVAYINRHVMRGVPSAMPLYRLARTAIQPGVARFEALIQGLTAGDREHAAEVITAIRA
jgi:class 3 adenylate cyclase